METVTDNIQNLNFPSRAESLQGTNNSVELSLSMISKGRKLSRELLLFSLGFYFWQCLFCVLFVAFWSWNLPFCLVFAAFWSWSRPCRLLFVPLWSWNLPFLLAICSILELEPSILHIFATFWNWNIPFCTMHNILELQPFIACSLQHVGARTFHLTCHLRRCWLLVVVC